MGSDKVLHERLERVVLGVRALDARALDDGEDVWSAGGRNPWRPGGKSYGREECEERGVIRHDGMSL